MVNRRLLVATLLCASACGQPAEPGTTTAAASRARCKASPETAADVALVGGHVHTGTSFGGTAVAIKNGRVLAVGTDAEIEALTGPGTRVWNLSGRTVTPGLVDGHAHLYGLGASLESVSLKGIKSEGEAAKAVAQAAAKRPGEWIEGRGWDQNLWPGKSFPTHASLDALVADQPVAVRRVDGHAMWVNAEALRRADITDDTRSPAGGEIVRDANGKATGVFVDNAMDLIRKHIPKPSKETIRRRIQVAASVAIENGLTGVHEMGISDATAAVYRELAAADELPLRVYALKSLDASDTAWLANNKPVVDPDGTAKFELRAVKMFADGALGSRGAALLAPYSDAPRRSGLIVTDERTLASAVKVAADNGFQVAVHAIGDRANRNTLDAFAAVPRGDQRFRVEHAQIVAPDDIPRFKQLGVLASVQPTHATSDMPWAEARIGPDRIRGAYAWRSLLDSGATIVSGSDFPIEDVPPLQGIYAAVTRQDKQGKPNGGWYPEQRMTLDEAIASFTIAPAYASFHEQHRGALAPGMIADITVFGTKLEASRALLDAKAEMTMLAGQPVLKKGWAHRMERVCK